MASTLKLFKALSENVRLRILHLLDNSPLNVSELVSILNQSQSTISHHVKTLVDLQLIEPQKRGNLNLYHLVKKPALPPAFLAVWQKKESLFRELYEIDEDYKKLLEILSLRKEKGQPEDWQSWRKLQPDLPYTYELAFRATRARGRVLDIGCGDGNFLQLLERSYEYLVGIDISEEQLAKSRKKKFQAECMVAMADGCHLPFSNEVFDSIYFRMSIQFFTEPTMALAEAARVLKPMGRIAIIDRIDSNERKADQSFNLEFFQGFCANSKKARVLHFKLHPHVFICVLEKF